MKFQYLGTAAAEGWPGLFCECDNCERARTAGGKNIRKRSQAIIDGVLLIDFPMDTYANFAYAGINGAKVHTCIVTHSHEDHFTPVDFFTRREPFAHIRDKKPVEFYAGGASIRKYHSMHGGKNPYEEDFVFHEIKPWDVFAADRYTITALPADHDQKSDPVNYIITDGDKTMFYAHDTGYFKEEIWQYLTDKQFRFDFVSLDCTNILLTWRTGHMGIDACADVKNRMIETGLADEKTIFCVNHFSHNGGLIYDEMVPVMAEYGMFVSYDGMEINF